MCPARARTAGVTFPARADVFRLHVEFVSDRRQSSFG